MRVFVVCSDIVFVLFFGYGRMQTETNSGNQKEFVCFVFFLVWEFFYIYHRFSVSKKREEQKKEKKKSTN